MPLFEVAIIEHPTKKDAEEGKSERLIFGPTAVIARDSQGAAVSAILDNTEKFPSVDKSRMEIIVRPFSKG